MKRRTVNNRSIAFSIDLWSSRCCLMVSYREINQIREEAGVVWTGSGERRRLKVLRDWFSCTWATQFNRINTTVIDSACCMWRETTILIRFCIKHLEVLRFWVSFHRTQGTEGHFLGHFSWKCTMSTQHLHTTTTTTTTKKYTQPQKMWLKNIGIEFWSVSDWSDGD